MFFVFLVIMTIACFITKLLQPFENFTFRISNNANPFGSCQNRQFDTLLKTGEPREAQHNQDRQYRF